MLHAAHHLAGAPLTVVWVLVATGLGGLALLAALRAGAPPRAVAPALIAFLETSVTVVAVFDGGLGSGAVFWLVVTPLAASFVGGVRLGWAVAVASTVVVGALFAAPAAGVAFPSSLSPADAALHYVLNAVCAVGLTAVLAALYEGPMARHLHRLRDQLAEANAGLRTELAERCRAQAQADSASRAKDALLSNLSHEFRTPLTSILGFTDPPRRRRRARPGAAARGRRPGGAAAARHARRGPRPRLGRERRHGARA